MICCYGHVAFTLVTKKDIDVILKLSDELLMKCFGKCGRASQSAAVSLVVDSPSPQKQTFDSTDMTVHQE
ncbi:hypothetical protein Q8A67_016391 [Cirrhinus molitorella]|uniref:Uncharacterized protein n=1 Tax=Cirrhinus molitorella TaxID=172907 RepID=A0AA88PGK1_9TELE|nr:hypothetical protein Q8A67_016391 [Cirrhinus molitorella]